jgi:hypothetical protein
LFLLQAHSELTYPLQDRLSNTEELELKEVGFFQFRIRQVKPADGCFRPPEVREKGQRKFPSI